MHPIHHVNHQINKRHHSFTSSSCLQTVSSFNSSQYSIASLYLLSIYIQEMSLFFSPNMRSQLIGSAYNNICFSDIARSCKREETNQELQRSRRPCCDVRHCTSLKCLKRYTMSELYNKRVSLVYVYLCHQF